MATFEFFKSIMDAYLGKSWASYTVEQEDFMKTCPKNKRGFYYYQIPGTSFVVHYKTGIDFRNPSRPYRVFMVNGLIVISEFGATALQSHPYTEVGVGKVKDRVFAVLGGKYVWMPPNYNWSPSVSEWEFYSRFFKPEIMVWGSRENLSTEERILFFLFHFSRNYEDYFAPHVLQAESRLHTAIRKEDMDGEAYWGRLLDIELGEYIAHIATLKERISHIW